MRWAGYGENVWGLTASDGSADVDRILVRNRHFYRLVSHKLDEILHATDEVTIMRGGRVVDRLRTGDVARRRPDGLYEVIGRRNRFAKVFGLRVDLDQVERVYGARGHLVHCASTAVDDGGERLVLAVDVSARAADVDELVAIAKETFGMPPRAVQVLALTEVPRLPNGKPDYRALVGLASHSVHEPHTRGARTPHPEDANPSLEGHDPHTRRREAVRTVLAEVLGRPAETVTDDDTFVTLEGDSLSYVEASIRLEDVLGRLPAGWHVTTVRDLAAVAEAGFEAEGSGAAPAGTGPAAATPRRRRGRTLETNVLLRALAIVMIVGSHANLFVATGGAHVLLAVAGFNFGRFHLTDAARRDRVRHLGTSLLRVVVPSVTWLAAVALLTRDIGWKNVLLLNGVLGSRTWTEPEWWYWFVEALVATLLVLTVVVATPWFDRAERRWSFWLPFGAAVGGLLTRYDVVSLFSGDEIHYEQRARPIDIAVGFGCEGKRKEGDRGKRRPRQTRRDLLREHPGLLLQLRYLVGEVGSDAQEEEDREEDLEKGHGVLLEVVSEVSIWGGGRGGNMLARVTEATEAPVRAALASAAAASVAPPRYG